MTISQQEILMTLKNYSKRSKKVKKKKKRYSLQFSSSKFLQVVEECNRVRNVLRGYSASSRDNFGERYLSALKMIEDNREEVSGRAARNAIIVAARYIIRTFANLLARGHPGAGRQDEGDPAYTGGVDGAGGRGPRVRALCLWFHNFRAAERAPSDESAPARGRGI